MPTTAEQRAKLAKLMDFDLAVRQLGSAKPFSFVLA